jgi:hypothetical protein
VSGFTLDGVTADGNSALGAGATVLMGPVGVFRSSFSQNKGGPGISFGTAGGAFFNHVTANGNQQEGASFSVDGPVQIIDSTFSDAQTNGGLRFSTIADDPSADITGSHFEHNAGFGISLDALTGGHDFHVSCNDIDGNLVGLVLTGPFGSTDTQVDARNNWWGSPTGPTDPSNPGGTGDSIQSNLSGTAVVFIPFLTTPAQQADVCRAQGAPAMHGPELLFSAFVLAMLARRALRRRSPGW